MICPRCDSKEIAVLAKAPKDDAWEVYKCDVCLFTWRSTESDDITDPDKYDRRFKIDPGTIPSLQIIPPIPELKK